MGGARTSARSQGNEALATMKDRLEIDEEIGSAVVDTSSMTREKA